MNETTSLCDSNAINEFRYCYQGDGKFPRAVFLGSDGIDDSYGDGEILNNFYIQLFKIIIRKGNESAFKELKKSLPIISQRGSKDDMSVACIYDDTALKAMFQYLTAYQQNVLEKDLAAIDEKRQTLEQKILNFGDPEKLDKPQLINLEYAKKDLSRAEDQAIRLKKRMTSLKGEITKFRNQMQTDLSADNETQEEISLSEED